MSLRGDCIAYAFYRFLSSTSSGGESTVSGGDLTVWDLDGKELFHLEEKGVGFDKPSLGPDGAASRPSGTEGSSNRRSIIPVRTS